ncbi:MAG: hypothetical protein LBN07_02590 [Christensenellaceae bacterium]|jgi:hypothetical protein|nr:hypothetical protein [Christensenellaceae bacterium]
MELNKSMVYRVATQSDLESYANAETICNSLVKFSKYRKRKNEDPKKLNDFQYNEGEIYIHFFAERLHAEKYLAQKQDNINEELFIGKFLIDNALLKAHEGVGAYCFGHPDDGHFVQEYALPIKLYRPDMLVEIAEPNLEQAKKEWLISIFGEETLSYNNNQ